MKPFTKNFRLQKLYKNKAIEVDDFSEKYDSLTNEELKLKLQSITNSLKTENYIYNRKNHFKSILKNKKYQWVVEALAITCIIAERILNMRAYGEQIMCSLALLDGKITEMKTGEGKTLSIGLASCVFAMEKHGIHVVTVNDYLAERDNTLMIPLFEALGLSSAVSLPKMDRNTKRKAYQADITYVTNTEVGFDYLKDNMVMNNKEKVLRNNNYVIIDEVDSILIDEARTPLIISGPNNENLNIYQIMDDIAKQMRPSISDDNERDYYPDKKRKKILLSDEGIEKVEKILVKKYRLPSNFNLFEPENISYVYHLNAALKAHGILSKETDYVVSDHTIKIVDEYTGRILPGRKWGDGLHQAVEAKEKINIHPEQQIVATITLQNLFKGYNYLSGATGTAYTEAEEFMEIYGKEVVTIPTHKPMIRQDLPDFIFLNKKAKFNKIIDDIITIHKTGQPLLVGTTSIETSEYLSKMLKKKNIQHNVLNAKYHEKEAEIIKNAGKFNAVTIATNMAGRGTDIILGGYKEKIENNSQWKKEHKRVIELGGLFILGTERHESRRIDNQLRGRAGRQGDPGTSRFYISFEDTLLSVFAPPWAQKALQRLGMGEGDILSKPAIGHQVKKSQKSVEDYYFSMRKSLLNYDNVNDLQRTTFYKLRDNILNHQNIFNFLDTILDDYLKSIIYDVKNNIFDTDSFLEQWNLTISKNNHLKTVFLISDLNKITFIKNNNGDSFSEKSVQQLIYHFKKAFNNYFFVDILTKEEYAKLIKEVILTTYDLHWQEHLYSLNMLRKGIHLRAYAQMKPIQAYKVEAFQLFNHMLDSINQLIIEALIKIKEENNELKYIHVIKQEESEMEEISH